jgi:hypothetical protein
MKKQAAFDKFANPGTCCAGAALRCVLQPDPAGLHVLQSPMKGGGCRQRLQSSVPSCRPQVLPSDPGFPGISTQTHHFSRRLYVVGVCSVPGADACCEPGADGTDDCCEPGADGADACCEPDANDCCEPGADCEHQRALGQYTPPAPPPVTEVECQLTVPHLWSSHRTSRPFSDQLIRSAWSIASLAKRRARENGVWCPAVRGVSTRSRRERTEARGCCFQKQSW